MGFLSDLAARLDPLTEARPNKSSAHNVKPELTPPKSVPPRAGYEYGIQIGGSSASTQDAFAQERLQILNQLYQAYLTCPWVSGPIDLIARTATAGGLDIVVDDLDNHEGAIPADPPTVTRLRRLMKFTNAREDMVQLLRSAAIDLLLFGDSYIEVVRLLGEPVALYTLDATTMTVLADEHGEVTGYKQSVDGIRSALFDPEDVIHISLDAPRGGVYGVSPAQKALLPVTAWLFTEATIKECFRRGDPPRVHVDLGSMKDQDVIKWREQYIVNNLGPKAVGTPILTTGGGVVTAIDPRKVEDYLQASRQLRDEIISCFGTPPSKLGIIEAGNIGGAGTAEGQDKTFRINTIFPVQALILEKLNYHLVQVGFGITGWHLEFGEVDMRDSKVVEDIRDLRLRNGAYTLNRYRDEIGEPPVDGGDDPVLIDRQNIVLWSNMDALSQAGIAYKLKGTALEPGDPQPGQPLDIQKPDQPDVIPMPQQPQPGQPAQPASAAGDPLPSPGASSGPDRGLPAKDRPGGAGDAAQGKAPRESIVDLLSQQQWLVEYLKERRVAAEALRPVPVADQQDLPEAPQMEPKEGELPTDPYWEADAHNHNDKPDYTPQDLGLEVLNRVITNPADLHYDHEHYQRPVDHRLVDKYTQESRANLSQRVGLVGIRSDGTAWCVDGQHHSLAAVREHINELTYQSFPSAGWQMEKMVYERFHAWHIALHGKEKDKAHDRIAPDVPEAAPFEVTFGSRSPTPPPPRRRPKRKKRR